MPVTSREATGQFHFARKVSFPGVIRPSLIPGTPYSTLPDEGGRSERARVHQAWRTLLPHLGDEAGLVVEAVVQDLLTFRASEADAANEARLEAAETLAAARADAAQARLEQRLENIWNLLSPVVHRRLGALELDKERRLNKMRPAKDNLDCTSTSRVRSRRNRPSFTKGLPMCAARVQELWQPSLPFQGRIVELSLCDYLTKWSEATLRDQHLMFKAMRAKSAEAAASFVPMTWRPQKNILGKSTGRAAESRDVRSRVPEGGATRASRAVVLLQSVLRGRAAQTHMWEELERYRDLVQEVIAPLGVDDEGLGHGHGPAPRPPTPKLYSTCTDEAVPDLFTLLDDVTVVDVVEAITERIMQLHANQPCTHADDDDSAAARVHSSKSSTAPMEVGEVA